MTKESAFIIAQDKLETIHAFIRRAGNPSPFDSEEKQKIFDLDFLYVFISINMGSEEIFNDLKKGQVFLEKFLREADELKDLLAKWNKIKSDINNKLTELFDQIIDCYENPELPLFQEIAKEYNPELLKFLQKAYKDKQEAEKKKKKEEELKSKEIMGNN